MTPPCVAFGDSPYRGRQQRPGRAGSALSAFGHCFGLIGLLLALIATPAPAQDGGKAPRQEQTRVAQPTIEKARGGQCVADPAFMRRNHMSLLKHQRDDTLRLGVRNARYSLRACVECHASRRTNSVASASGDFCQSCHEYAAVSMDCFECHANKPGAGGPVPALTQVKP